MAQISASRLKPGMVYQAHYGPRTITRVAPERDTSGRHWLKWFWKPEQRLDGGMDCGFGGVLVESADVCMVTVEVQP